MFNQLTWKLVLWYILCLHFWPNNKIDLWWPLVVFGDLWWPLVSFDGLYPWFWYSVNFHINMMKNHLRSPKVTIYHQRSIWLIGRIYINTVYLHTKFYLNNPENFIKIYQTVFEIEPKIRIVEIYKCIIYRTYLNPKNIHIKK